VRIRPLATADVDLGPSGAYFDVVTAPCSAAIVASNLLVSLPAITGDVPLPAARCVGPTAVHAFDRWDIRTKTTIHSRTPLIEAGAIENTVVVLCSIEELNGEVGRRHGGGGRTVVANVN